MISKQLFIGILIGALVVTVVFGVLLLLSGGQFARFEPVAWLVEKLSGEHQFQPVPGKQGKVEYWTCTMHPAVRRKAPGKCPLCSMDLVPVKKESARVSTGQPEDPTADALRAHSTFLVDPRRQQLMNVQITSVETRPLEKLIRTVAILKLDETRIRHVHAKIKGWIDQVFVSFNHQHVKEGDPLFSIYSPELVSTQEEYLLALKTAEELSDSPFKHVFEGGRSLLQATRRRLQFFDINEEQIRRLQETGQVQKHLILYSPSTGHVVKRNAYPNMYVTPDSEIYTIVDHTHIWAQVKIYETDIPYVHEGQRALMATVAYPGEVFHGKVTYVYPHLNEKTRTMNVRLEFPNPGLKLKPEMYADVQIKVPLGEHLVVPESAVLRTGTRDLVFVDLSGGNMQLRRIELGVQAGGLYQVLGGLEEGERVVTAANFLIDAESKVQGVEAAWQTPKPR